MSSTTLSDDPIEIGTPEFEALVEQYVPYFDALPEAFPDYGPLPPAYKPNYPGAWLFAYRSWYTSQDPQALADGAYNAGELMPPSPFN